MNKYEISVIDIDLITNLIMQINNDLMDLPNNQNIDREVAKIGDKAQCVYEIIDGVLSGYSTKEQTSYMMH